MPEIPRYDNNAKYLQLHMQSVGSGNDKLLGVFDVWTFIIMLL